MVKKNPSAPLLETSSQLYPDLTAELSAETNNSDQYFRLKQICEIRDKLEQEAETRGRLRRRYKAFYSTTHYVNMGSSLTAVASSTAAAISLSTGVGAIAAFPLGIVAIATGVIGVVSSKIGKLVLKKCEKHERIKYIALSKLSSISNLVSKALTDKQISQEEFEVILQEMESYRDHKSQIRNRVRNELSNEREEEIRVEAEKKGLLKGQEMALTNLQTILKHADPSGESP